jgi:SAM-dependent methyltransferase
MAQDEDAGVMNFSARPSVGFIDSIALIDQQLAVWRRKPVLRAVYKDYHKRLVAALPQSLGLPVVEIGGGAGHFKEHYADSVCVDIIPTPAADVLADAHRLPFKSGGLSGLVLLDVLHHLAEPKEFFAEIGRVLAVGGRFAMIEPAMTPFARFFYRHFHREAVDLSASPFAPGNSTQLDEDPMASNQAIPWLIFHDNDESDAFQRDFTNMKIVRNELLSLFAYPLCGGFQRWALIPRGMVQPLLRLENLLEPLIGRFMAFRMFVVIEKTSDSAAY